MDILLLGSVCLPFIAAIPCYIVKKHSISHAISVLVSVAVLAATLAMYNSEVSATLQVCGGLSFEFGGFRAVYGVLTAFLWCIVTCFMPGYVQHRVGRFQFYTLLTYGGTLGMLYATDLMTAFICFEIMSFASYMWVIHDESDKSLDAGNTYLTLTIIGGFAFLMGIMILSTQLGTLEISKLSQAVNEADPGMILAAGICMLVGFGAKAGAVPLHFWAPKAYPAAPAPATALFSGILSKTGLFGMIIVTVNIFSDNQTWGEILLVVGTATMVLGGLRALFGTDLKGILACSSISQIGFIIIGISMITLLGDHNSYASGGVLVYMINHSLMKVVLFLCAGIVFINTGKLALNDVKGYGRGKPVLAVCFAVAGLGMAGLPLLSGYIGKTLVHESLIEYAHAGGNVGLVEVLFTISGGLTLAYVLKMFVVLFIEKPNDAKPKKQQTKQQSNEFAPSAKLKAWQTALIILPTLLIIAGGIFPNQIFDPLVNYSSKYLGMHGQLHAHYFSVSHILGALMSIGIGLILYFTVVLIFMRKKGVYVKPLGNGWDVEKSVYKPFVFGLLQSAVGAVCKFFAEYMLEGIAKALDIILSVICRFLSDGMDILVYGFKKFLFKPNRDRHIPTVDELKRKQAKIEAKRIVFGNLSFGLLMAGIGLFLTVMYVLISSLALGL